MGIITLTTDFGYGNWYAGTMKGVILKIAPDAKIVSLNHGITNFDILEASLSIMSSYMFFPEGTVHIVVVDPGVGGKRRHIVAKVGHHIFVAPDNGALSGLFCLQNVDIEVFHAINSGFFLPFISDTFHGRDVFAPIAAHISNGVALDKIGVRINDPVILDEFSPKKISDSVIEAEIIFVDKFGNLITNARKECLTGRVSVELPCGNIKINGLKRSYDEAHSGEAVLIIGSSGFLEICVNRGNASEKFNLNKKDYVRVNHKLK